MLVTALLFALAQGFTEFLPVSSSGHLVLLTLVLGEVRRPGLMISALHLVTATVAVVYYRRQYAQAVSGIWQPGAGREFARRYVGAQVVSLAMITMLGLLTWTFAQTVAARWLYEWTLGGLMLLNAAILLAAPRRDDAPSDGVLPALTWRAAAWVGLAQGLAAAPGLSRSGLTMAAGLWAGLSPAHASSFCFLLAPPVMLAPALYHVVVAWPQASTWLASWQSVAATLVVILVTFLVALGSLRWTVAWVRAGRLWWFAPWSGLAGIITLAAAAW